MKSGNTRPSPAIPDHEVLRKIGGGAYGEVWLARGVTGALRAVKVVWREDFEDERTFEREFDGILKFEPISRDHPGLVNILHVGRSTGEESFYYYVMELGDDVATGREINPVEYEPLTLRCDHHEGPAERWPVEDCIEIGLRLAQALQHLHDKGLAHRDVKPSNVIFVNGKAKLADIGLVAARGQRTFVGTEGFVPPEGPGSAKADVYSLGKVLYEIATGMDRMNFPELPDDMPMGRNRRRWLELNRIICEVCEPRITKRKISSGGELAAALTRIQRGKRRRPGFKSLALTVLFLLSVSLWGSWHVVKDTEWFQAWLNPIPEVEEIEGLYRIFSTPEGADVINSDGEIIGTTPTQVMKGIVGEGFHYVLRKEGFRPYHLDGIISLEAKDEPMVLHGELQIFSPPVIGEPWTNHLDHVYQPDGNAHLSATYVDRELWEQAQQTLKIHKRHFDYIKATENGVEEEIVLTTENFARQFAGWMQEQTLEAGFLTEDHEIRSVWDKTFTHPGMSDKAQKAKLRPFRLRAKRIIYASIGVTSSPPGAELSINGEPKGLTHGEMVVTGIKPGRIELKLELEGYKPLTKSYELEDGEPFQVHLELKKNQSVEFGKPWTNGIGMKFVPVGKDLMVSVWETRQRDYQKFLNEEVHQDPKPALFEQTDDHPVVNVSRKDAELFCEWLTRRERSKERITQSHEYRLPTDLEWSRFVGLLNEDPEASPGTRDSRKKEIFPWGPSLEEANIPGNFADMEAAVHPDTDVDRTIRGYDDGFAFTAPVGSFEPNELGLHDLSGNIQEWVSDAYSVHAQNSLGVLRGGGWNTYQLENLYSGARNAAPVDYAGPMYGFRVVIARKPLELADPETESP